MVRIKIVPDIKKNDEEMDLYLERVMKGEQEIEPELQKRTLIMEPEVFTKVFSPQRIRLILKVKDNKITNIYQLAKELGRKYEAVHRDIKYLSGLGIIKIKKKDKKRIPLINGTIKINEITAS
jgi:predicted transcriptional regulator